MLLLACIKKKLKMFSYPMDIWMDALTEEMPEATLLFFYSPPLFFFILTVYQKTYSSLTF